MKLHRSVLTGACLVGVFVLAGIGAVEGDAAVAFAVGAISLPGGPQLTGKG